MMPEFFFLFFYFCHKVSYFRTVDFYFFCNWLLYLCAVTFPLHRSHYANNVFIIQYCFAKAEECVSFLFELNKSGKNDAVKASW